MIPNPEFSKKADEMLTEQVSVLSLLASGPGTEFVFFTYDIEGTVRYLSESSWKVLQIRPENWRRQSFYSRLTDHKWNTSCVHSAEGFEVDRIHRCKCELRDDFRVGMKIDLWRRPVHLEGNVIGVVGMAKRSIDIGLDGNTHQFVSPNLIRERIASLSRAERDVIELVIAGELNKSIAVKLDIAMRTVESRRSKAMSKMGVDRLADLVRIWFTAQEASSKAK
ncbi:MAG: LuxR C-terminal-related transcriptional regulator [Planctomycetota bacterium]|nr:LuxR C-terminal-related transcriptional regulator [Planctomycetota bacterium]